MLWLLAGMGLLLAAGGLALSGILGSQLRRDYDAALIAKARSLETLTEERGGKVWVEFSDKIMPEFERRENPDYFQLWLRKGPVLERSRSLGDHDLSRAGGPLDRPRLSDVVLPDGRRGRQVEISFQPRSEVLEQEEETEGRPGASDDLADHGPRATLAVAHSREDLDALLASVQVTLIVAVLGLLGGTALLIKMVVGITLLPLDRLAHQLAGMGVDSLGRELPREADAPAEIVPVIHHLNALLARLDASFVRERSFSANLAHELRTPLAELRAMTEVALKWPDDGAATLEALREAQDIGAQMERVVVNLLALARFDGKQQTVSPSEMRLRELAASSWEAFCPEAEARQMTFELAVPEPLRVVTDREKLALLLANLFSNAVAHGRPGGVVACAASVTGDEFELRVGNFTDSLTVADLPRIFDRFWRKDPARSGGRHAGLGLSLVSALCDLLELTKQASLADGWFEITLRGRLSSSSILHPSTASLAAAGGRSSGFAIQEAT